MNRFVTVLISIRARDVYRHPVETLDFFGIEPGMTVMEIWPGGGWYTELLAPAMRDYGKLIIGVTRTTTIIGPDGKVIKHWKKVPKAADHPQKVLEFLKS